MSTLQHLPDASASQIYQKKVTQNKANLTLLFIKAITNKAIAPLDSLGGVISNSITSLMELVAQEEISTEAQKLKLRSDQARISVVMTEYREAEEKRERKAKELAKKFKLSGRKGAIKRWGGSKKLSKNTQAIFTPYSQINKK